MRMLLVAAVLCGCGGARPVLPLTGDVSVTFLWSGDWSADEQAAAATFVAELSASSYFDALQERGIRPHFVVVAQGGIPIQMYKPGYTDQPPCGWHGYDSGPFIGVSAVCITSITLSHELVEMAADPEGDGDEIADACASHVLIQLPSGPANVARYMTREGCAPP
jgi:hypothetical protein